MEKALQVLNELERKGELGRYAIGGAMAATFYLKPVLTFDLDIVVVLPESAGGLLTLAPLYQALRARGYTADMDGVTPEIERLLDAKQARRRQLARLPFPEKVRIVVRLQEMAAPLLRARRKPVYVWPADAL